ncbi:hypothetical protein DSL72_003780 [Monilinia vaccinii-corymbosi]|uniref:Uncharacterized protein n=1 Tax=Monilinia vaccinii-corymbosi TaxID=61207 RepID=A0A8A3P6H4_9HELO|nr:hypothetical protein DSL72_003780 [Monilinia vaccinii-corymbosi]
MPNQRPRVGRHSRKDFGCSPKVLLQNTDPNAPIKKLMIFFKPIDDWKDLEHEEDVKALLKGSECTRLLNSREKLLGEDLKEMRRLWEDFKVFINDGSLQATNQDLDQIKMFIYEVDCLIFKSREKFAGLVNGAKYMTKEERESSIRRVEDLIRNTYYEAKKEWELMIGYLKGRMKVKLKTLAPTPVP